MGADKEWNMCEHVSTVFESACRSTYSLRRLCKPVLEFITTVQVIRLNLYMRASAAPCPLHLNCDASDMNKCSVVLGIGVQ